MRRRKSEARSNARSVGRLPDPHPCDDPPDLPERRHRTTRAKGGSRFFFERARVDRPAHLVVAKEERRAPPLWKDFPPALAKGISARRCFRLTQSRVVSRLRAKARPEKTHRAAARSLESPHNRGSQGEADLSAQQSEEEADPWISGEDEHSGGESGPVPETSEREEEAHPIGKAPLCNSGWSAASCAEPSA